MRSRLIASAAVAVALSFAAATSAPASPEVSEFRGRIALPAPMLSGELASSYFSAEYLRRTCPSAGEGDGMFYKFFDLQGGFKHFYLEGPTLPVDEWLRNNPGEVESYDLDLYVFDSKCNPLELEGEIMTTKGVGGGVAKEPAHYAVVAYFSGPPDLPVRLTASATPFYR